MGLKGFTVFMLTLSFVQHIVVLQYIIQTLKLEILVPLLLGWVELSNKEIYLLKVLARMSV